MNESSQIVGSGLNSRQVNEGVQNNYSDVTECSNVGIASCGKKFVSSPESEKTLDISRRQYISWFKRKFVRFICLKSATTPISDDRDQGAVEHDSQNSRLDPNLKTIENWLNRFDQPTILPRLEESLEGVKRNKISKESHEQLSKLLDKELLKLSLKFHPDHAGDQEWQSALNAIRKVLKTLTVVFLENNSVDYKYEYFSKLDISSLANEKKINDRIEKVLYRICVLSETKRVNIIGEIRNFLIESEKCVKSYFEDNKSDFEKYRNYALYHLQKNIEGYKKLENEYNIIIEECSKGNDSMTAVLQNVASQSERESKILRSLESVARRSFQGNFKIFPVPKAMDDYFISPFVGYVNVLSICNLLLQPKRFSSLFFSRVSSSNAEKLRLFTNAYIKDSSTVEAIEELKDISKKLHKILEEIFPVLQKDYIVAAYNEGKSKKYEVLLTLEEYMEDLKEKEKYLTEWVNRLMMEMEKFSDSLNYRREIRESFIADMTEQEKESEEDTSKYNSHLDGGEILKESYKYSEMCH